MDMKYSEPKVVAELCCNHMGDLDIAKKMILAAAQAGANYAKFQKWNAKTALSAEHYNAPHPNPRNSFGEPYGKHRENLEFEIWGGILKYICSIKALTTALMVF